MKKVINGKLYNTKTATFLGEYTYSNPRDFRYFSEELYRKTNGEYFLWGEGSCLSHYDVAVGQNSWAGSKNIRPLSEAEAKEWVETYLDGDAYIEIFGEPEE